MKKQKMMAVVSAAMLAAAMPVQTVWADTVQETSGEKAEGYDEQYPLSEYRDWFAEPIYPQMQLQWRWDDDYIGTAGLLKTGDYTPNSKYGSNPNYEYIYRHAIMDDDFRYLMCPKTGVEKVVIAKLSGVEPIGYDEWFVNGEEVAKLENVTREFLNSFDWRNASDEEKAVRIVKRINQARYDYSDDLNVNKSNLTYGCLVNGTAQCGGYVNAACYLGFCVNLPVSGHGVGNHMYSLFRVNGVWLSNDSTTKDATFRIYDPSEGYYMAGDMKCFQQVGEYCDRTGYQMPETLDGIIQDMRISDGTRIYKSTAYYGGKNASVMQFQ